MILLPFSLYYIAFYSTLLIGEGELTNEVYSPNSQYVAKVYRVGDEGGLRVDVNTGLFGSERLIYWSWKETEEKVKWLDDTHIKINERVLDVRFEKYDKRTMD
ncbi:hypothetical protein E8L90_13245 [Brevibacillus antibioticus]|uniref:DUF5412 domain-containing protein n=1 Tax=Brevibacillus antibioticus TaxID=2570228 RepID=A0A4U2YEF8_9BACL|nr:hypothetical protein E8L90_13245 [Brevibacillus antibioticus]